MEQLRYIDPVNRYIDPVNRYIDPVNRYIDPVNRYIDPLNNHTTLTLCMFIQPFCNYLIVLIAYTPDLQSAFYVKTITSAGHKSQK